MNSNQDYFAPPPKGAKQAIDSPSKPTARAERFSRSFWKNLIILGITVVAIVFMVRSVDFAQLKTILLAARPTWIIIGFLAALGISISRAVVLHALAPQSFKFSEVAIAEIAAALAAVIAPSGVGTAAVNLRYLIKKKIHSTLALATVTLVQLFHLCTTGIALVVVLGITGRELNFVFAGKILLIIAIMLGFFTLVLIAFPAIRKKFRAYLAHLRAQVGPLLADLRHQPRKIAVAIIGCWLQIIAMIGCFYSCCLALNIGIPIKAISITFLISNTLGSSVPTPGGIGPVEAALSGGLQLLGLSAAIALSVAILYRLLTVWLRAACGWVALAYLKHRNLL